MEGWKDAQSVCADRGAVTNAFFIADICVIIYVPLTEKPSFSEKTRFPKKGN